jgi:hypothetical protein
MLLKAKVGGTQSSAAPSFLCCFDRRELDKGFTLAIDEDLDRLSLTD